MAIPPEKFAQIMSRLGISNNTQVIIYDDLQGLLAARFFWLLEYYGHEKVALLNGGYPQWAAENRELTKLLPDISPDAFISSADPTRLATKEYILSTMGREEVILVDARSPVEYKGGHIPGAVNINWLNGVDGEPAVFKSAQELYRLYYESGAGPDKEIITYCQTGVRAAHSYFQLRLLGYESVRVYDGSWEEWGSDADLPIEK
jgi:thiosulfate/3-mercaptopyruvate sulfurtransferase